MSALIAPSVLSANFNYLGRDIEMINQSEADWFHLDVMDGVFVPNISFGFPIIRHIKKLSQKPLDVHLMIVQPERYLEAFAEVGADILTVHFEACTHLHRTLQTIRNLGIKTGVAINPHTSVQALEVILPEVDLLLIMSVNPGFGGQKFIQQTFNKIEQAKAIIQRQGLRTIIEVDGGVDISNARALKNAGADVLVAGNAVFAASDPAATIAQLKSA